MIAWLLATGALGLAGSSFYLGYRLKSYFALKQENAQLQNNLKDVEKAHAIDNKVDALSDAAVDDQLLRFTPQ